MCTSLDGSSIILPNGNRRNSDGSLTLKKDRPTQVVDRKLNATDVPIGDGLADAAKLALLSRRERIRSAVEGE